MTPSVVSQETAQKLKEKGWKQEDASHYHSENVSELRGKPAYRRFAAPSIGELLEALPNPYEKEIEGQKHYVSNFKLYRCDDDTWEAYFADWNGGETWNGLIGRAPNPADALALLWLALKEKGIV